MKISNYVNTVKSKKLIEGLLALYNKCVLPHLNIKKPAKFNETNVRNLMSYIAKNVNLLDAINYIKENAFKDNKVTTLSSLTGGFTLNGVRTYHGVNLAKIIPTDNFEACFDSYEADEELDEFVMKAFNYENGFAYETTPTYSASVIPEVPKPEVNPIDVFAEDEEGNAFENTSPDVTPASTPVPNCEPTPSTASAPVASNGEPASTSPLSTMSKEEMIAYLQKLATQTLQGYQLVLEQNAVDMLNQALEGKKQEIQDALTKIFFDNQLPSTVIKIDKIEHQIPGQLYHEKFESVLKAVANKMDIYLYSKAGIGKSHLVIQVAKALKMKLFFMLPGNAIDLLGYSDAYGQFHETAFTRWCREGGILYGSEFDANDASLILNLNTALANGYTVINGETVTLHEDCVFIADGNSKMTGATATYAGRQRQDASIIDRLLFIEMGNDYKLELSLSGNNKEWITFIKSFREEVEAQGSNMTVSLRATIGVRKAEQIYSTKEALEMCLLKGANIQLIKAISEKLAIKLPQNKYAKALLEVK